MKTLVADTSLACYKTIAPLMADQDQLILSAMIPGEAYSRRELGLLAGIENSASARACNGLVKSGHLVECGVKSCRRTGRTVGALALSMAAV